VLLWKTEFASGGVNLFIAFFADTIDLIVPHVWKQNILTISMITSHIITAGKRRASFHIDVPQMGGR